MRNRCLAIAAIALVVLLAVSLFIFYGVVGKGSSTPKVYVGVEVGASNVNAVENCISQVSSYTNLVVISSSDITGNFTALQQVCQYAYSRNLNFIIYEGTGYASHISDLAIAYNLKATFGDRFLGIYAGDEPGGKQLEEGKTYFSTLSTPPDNYSDAESQFESYTQAGLNVVTQSADLPLFTSDWGLYWFDYEAGYDVVFTEFGWNDSRQMDIALCRGAATAQAKAWGAMITWTYQQPPYLENSTQLLSDMKLAYNAGASYIVIFDCDENGSAVLNPDQLNSMRQFWQYAKTNPQPSDPPSSRVAYVLPNAYGYGFGSLNDSIWGIWPADNFSAQQYTNINNALQQYGGKLDVVFDDPSFPNCTGAYSKLILWNQTATT